MSSGLLRVARGGFGAKAPPLAARLVPWNGRGGRLVELTVGCDSRENSQGLPMCCNPRVIGMPTISFQ